MIVETVIGLARFDALENAWHTVHANDPGANIFTSWAWLRGWLVASASEWVVLGVRAYEGGDFIAFLPLSFKVYRGRWGDARILRLAGHPVSNHTGLLCLPGAEEAALDALARAMKGLRWRGIHFELVADARLERLLGRLGPPVRRREDAPSPYLTLPDTPESFRDVFSPKARRELGRRERKAARRGLTHSEARTDDFARHLDALLTLHEARFGPVLERHLTLYRSLFTSCFEAGTLHLNALWDGAQPVSAQVGFLDRKQGVYHGCQGGWDEVYRDLAPGLLVKLRAIDSAIRDGFHTFDLGRGAHAYKVDLGAQMATTLQLRVTRPRWFSRSHLAAFGSSATGRG